MKNAKHCRWLATSAFIGFAIAGSAQAQEEKYQFDIPAEALGQALTDFSQTSSKPVFLSEQVVRGRTTNGIHGQYTAQQALDLLLAGTDLKVVTNASGVLMVQPKNVQSASNEEAAEPSPSDAPAQADSLESVVVTANKRAERLQDVPSAVTAVTAGDLQNLQITDTTSLLDAVPSLSFQQGTNPQNASLRIRGIGTSLFGVGTTSDVVTIIDGVSVAKNAQNYFNFNDIAQVEVLRGPQVTLFGDGASAGAINVISEKPTDDFTVAGQARLAEGTEYRLSSTISGPITDGLSARISGYYNNIPGILNEVHGGTADAFRDWGLHTIVEWQAAENLKFQFGVTFAANNDPGFDAALISTKNPTLISQLGFTPGPGNHVVNDDNYFIEHTNGSTYSLQADWNLGEATITSITGYQYFYLNNQAEVDGIYNGGNAGGSLVRPPTSAVPIYVGCAKATSANCQSEYDLNGGSFSLKQFSQELRIANNGTDRLNYLAGIYYQTVGTARPFFRARAYCAAGTAAQLFQPCTATEWDSYASFGYVRDTSIAGFGQADYRIFDQLKIQLGARVQNEAVSAQGNPLGDAGSGLVYDAANPGPGSNAATVYKNFGPVTAGKETVKDTMVGGKISLQYEFSDRAQAYVSATKGFKGSGWNAAPTTNYATQTPVHPEYVTAYEAGFKGATNDGMATIAAAIFDEQYKNLQVQVAQIINGAVQAQQTNAGTSFSRGFEIESVFRPFEGFTLAANATLAVTGLNLPGNGCPIENVAGITAANTFATAAAYQANPPPAGTCYSIGGTAFVDDKGGQLPASPRWHLNFAPRYQHDIMDDYVGFLQFNINYQSSERFDINQDSELRQGAFWLVDTNVGLLTNDGHYGVSFFIKNLFNQNYYSNMAHPSELTAGSQTPAGNIFPDTVVGYYNKDAQRYFGVNLNINY